MIIFRNRRNVHTIPIMLSGISFTIFLFFSFKEKPFRFSKIRAVHQANYCSSYSSYCKREVINSELNAVESSFFGDYENTMRYATENAQALSLQPVFTGSTSKKEVIKKLEMLLRDSTISDERKLDYQRLLKVLGRQEDLQTLFQSFAAVDAKEYIIQEAGNYHYLLLNEAHYSSQNRAFTADLLKPLWKKGYRYLALEALAYSDTSLNERGYPVYNTGYYLQDPVFGNMIREAIQIGYKIVPYESQNGSNGTERDFEQAKNIYENTWGKDTIGKVVIHAGYGHILETGAPSYQPMGKQLKVLAGQDILTVDQERMTNFLDESKLNPYYSFVKSQLGIDHPIIFLNGESLVDPLSYGGIDLQVYHPPTTFIYGRPSWLLRPPYRIVPLPKDFFRFVGQLVEVKNKEEVRHSIPVDRTIIRSGVGLVLPAGEYKIGIIDCDGSLIAECNLSVK